MNTTDHQTTPPRVAHERETMILAYLSALEVYGAAVPAVVTTTELGVRVAAAREAAAATSGTEHRALVRRVARLEGLLGIAAELVVDALVDLEGSFVEAAMPYSLANGVGFRAWTEVGVPREVLLRCGLRPGRRGSRAR